MKDSIRAKTRSVLLTAALARNILFSARLSDRFRRTTLVPPTAVARITNPSICLVNSQWLVAARAPKFSVNRDGSYRLDDGVDRIDSDSIVLRLNSSLATECHSVLSLPTAVEGQRVSFEDPRLSVFGDRTVVLWSALRAESALDTPPQVHSSYLPNWDGASNVMAIAGMDETSISAIRQINSPFGRPREKNWMPIVGSAYPEFIYQAFPGVHVKAREDKLIVEEVASVSELRGWSGSSQLVPWRGGWLAVLHLAGRRAKAIPFLRRPVYLHRFVAYDENLRVSALSRSFRFDQLGIEFCAGLAVLGERIVLSYGRNDETAHLLEMDQPALEKMLRPVSSRLKPRTVKKRQHA